MSSASEGRPYHFHQLVACIPCRKHKSRCKLGPVECDRSCGEPEACLMCKVHGSPYVSLEIPFAGSSAITPSSTRLIRMRLMWSVLFTV